MSGDKSLLGQRINCPDCLEPFYVTIRKSERITEPTLTGDWETKAALYAAMQPPASSPATQGIRVGSIVRDVIIVWILTAMGGFIVGFTNTGRQQDPQGNILALVAANFLLGTVAFTIVGCLAPPERWRHLGFVAIGAWFTSIINVIFLGVTIPQWIFGALFMAFIMGFGGAISYVFKK